MKDNPVEYDTKDEDMIRKYIQLSDYQCGMAMGLLLSASTIFKQLEIDREPETA